MPARNLREECYSLARTDNENFLKSGREDNGRPGFIYPLLLIALVKALFWMAGGEGNVVSFKEDANVKWFCCLSRASET